MKPKAKKKPVLEPKVQFKQTSTVRVINDNEMAVEVKPNLEMINWHTRITCLSISSFTLSGLFPTKKKTKLLLETKNGIQFH